MTSVLDLESSAGLEARINDYAKRIEQLEFLLSKAAPLGRRNLVDNGAMMIAQRITSNGGITSPGFFVAGVANGASLDRWMLQINTLGTWTNGQQSGGPTGTGLQFANRWTCTTIDASPTSGDYAYISQAIEGQNLQRLLWGAAAAKPLTLSFWARSNISGTFIAELFHGTVSSSRSYTLVANTWTYITLTFTGDTAATIPNTAAAEMYAIFWLAASSSHNGGGALNQGWSATVNTRAVGQTNLASTNGNFIEWTGVQLEVGSFATPFETSMFADELRRCQRWFEKSYDYSTAVGSAVNNGSAEAQCFDAAVLTRFAVRKDLFRVEKLSAAPTIRIYSTAGTLGALTPYNGGTELTHMTLGSGSSRMVTSSFLVADAGVLAMFYYFQWTATCE